MTKRVLSASLLSGVIACSALTPSLAAEPAQSTDKTPWKVTGELEEACSCHPPCPCWFMSVPSRMTCDGVQAVFIKKGKYGKTPLDGLALVEFVQSPENKSMFESFGNWNFDNLYIDQRASEDQRAALQAIAMHLFPFGAKSRSVHFAPITRKIEGTEHSVTIGEVGYFSGHLLDGGFPGSPKISNVPLADPTHKEFQQGQNTKLTYSDSGQGWKYEHSNYMFNTFKVDNKDYMKFEADMAKKLAAMGDGKEK